MKKIKRFDEEYNKLLKVRVYVEGNQQYRLKPVSDKKGNQVNKGEFRFRGTEDDFALLLRRLKAKDHDTDPPSAKNRTYKQMIQTARDGSDPYIWIWNKHWQARNTIQKVER
jgi:hypothetical protein